MAWGGVDGASVLKGRLSFARSSVHRTLDISLEYVVLGSSGAVLMEDTLLYSMGITS